MKIKRKIIVFSHHSLDCELYEAALEKKEKPREIADETEEQLDLGDLEDIDLENTGEKVNSIDDALKGWRRKVFTYSSPDGIYDAIRQSVLFSRVARLQKFRRHLTKSMGRSPYKDLYDLALIDHEFEEETTINSKGKLVRINNGIDLAKLIYKIDPGLPVIMTSIMKDSEYLKLPYKDADVEINIGIPCIESKHIGTIDKKKPGVCLTNTNIVGGLAKPLCYPTTYTDLKKIIGQFYRKH